MTDPVVPYLIHAIRNAVAVTLRPHHNPSAETQLFLLLGELEDATLLGLSRSSSA